jgi:hypothetical protein
MMNNSLLYNLFNKFLKAIGRLIYAVKKDFVCMIMINGEEAVMELFVHLIRVFFETDSYLLYFMINIVFVILIYLLSNKPISFLER